MSCSYQTLQCLLNPWQGVGVLLHTGAQMVEVIQKCKPLSFFLTNTTMLHHTLWLGHMAPDSNISSRWLWTSSTKGEGIHLNHSLKGVSSVNLIICSVDWVQPNLAGSNEKILWYSAKSCWAESASSGGPNSNPLRSSSSNSFPCLCLMVNLGVWGLWGLFSPSGNLVSTSSSGTTVTSTVLATRVFFLKVWG